MKLVRLAHDPGFLCTAAIATVLATACGNVTPSDLDASGGDDAAAGADGSVADAAPNDAVPVFSIFQEAEDGTVVPSNNGENTFVVDTAIGGFGGTGYLRGVAGNIDNCFITNQGCADIRHQFDLTQSRVVDLWVRAYSIDQFDDEWYAGFDDQLTFEIVTATTPNTWEWSLALTTTLVAGSHTATVRQRDKRVKIDAIAIRESGSGPPSP